MSPSDPRTYAKALLAALIAGVGALSTAVADSTVTPAEWVGILLAALTALGVVYGVPNATRAKGGGHGRE